MAGFLSRTLPGDATATRSEVREGVVISGAGPVGLFAALILARAGIAVTVLEKGSRLSEESRASTFHPATLELLDQFGLATPVIEAGLIAPTTQFRDRVTGPVATFDLSVLADETDFAFRVQLEQSKLTPMAMHELERLRDEGASVEIRFEHRVHGARHDGDGVQLLVGTEHELIEMRADWVLGADGAQTPVRTSIGIDIIGEQYPERFLVMSLRDELDDVLSDLCYVNYVADPNEWLVLLRTPDHWRVLVPTHDDNDADILAPAQLQQRLRSVADLGREYELLAASLYVVKRQVASTMRQQRVLLIGDAAHQNSPLGGMGMNSGLQDAYSASTRLVRVIHGGNEALLDEFDQLRRSVARDFVQADSHANWQALRERDPVVRQRLQRELAAEAADPIRRRQRARRSAMLDSVRSHL